MKNVKKRLMWISSGLFMGLLLFATSMGCLFSSPVYTGPKTDHFDGERFYNQDRTQQKGLLDFIKWRTNQDQGPWPGVSEPGFGPPPPVRVGPGELRVTFVNHSTVLIQIDGLNILTDPIWSERSSPVTWAGPKRVRPPGIRFEDLPPIHAVLISHNHYDHMDVPTLRDLSMEHGPRVLAGLGNAKLLRNKQIDKAYDMDWWNVARLSDTVRVVFVPAQHWSARGAFDHHKTLWGGFVVEGSRHRVYYSGDTGFGPHFAQIKDRFGPIDLALLPIGAFKPRWFMAASHLSPHDAVKAHQILGARRSLAVHFGTFPQGDDGEHEPVEVLQQVLAKTELTEQQFWVLGFGEGRQVPSTNDLIVGDGTLSFTQGLIHRSATPASLTKRHQGRN